MSIRRTMILLLLTAVLYAACTPLNVPVVSTLAPPTATQGGAGTVRGQLERYDGTPLKGIIIYAAVIGQSGDTRLASVDALADPHVDTDAQGRFEIKNLQSGEYVLGTQSPIGIILPHDKGDKMVTFKVSAGQETDLGKLSVGYTFPDGQ